MFNYRDENENIWFWQYDNFKLYYDIGEQVRLKVIEVSFKSTKDIAKIVSESTAQANTTEGLPAEAKSASVIFSLDSIIEILCTFNQEGLGPIKWWNSNSNTN